jgi:hypothetical protein
LPNIHPGNGIDGVANSVVSQKLSDFVPRAGIVDHERNMDPAFSNCVATQPTPVVYMN